MTVHEKLDKILNKVDLGGNFLLVEEREHTAAGSLYNYTYTLSNVSQYSYLLVVLTSFSNVLKTCDTSISCPDLDHIVLAEQYYEANNVANAQLGVYLIPNPYDGMTINAYTSSGGIERIWGF